MAGNELRLLCLNEEYKSRLCNTEEVFFKLLYILTKKNCIMKAMYNQIVENKILNLI